MNKKILLSTIAILAINLNAQEIGNITVESSTIDDKFDTKKLEISTTATMQGTEIEEFHAENLTEVLNTIPGVTVRKNEGDSNKIHIRGIATEMYMGEKPGVAIVIDGVPVQERSGSVNIDVDNIESIKVIKGGASYLYGNDALAGAIVITTKRAKSKNEGIVSAETASHGYQKYLASYNYGNESFATNVQASYKKSDGYWEDSDYYTKSISGKFQYYIDDSSDITFGADKTLRYENDSGSITHTTYNPDTGKYTNNIQTNPTSIGEVGYSTEFDIDLTKLFLTYSKDFDNGSNLMAQIYRYDDTTKNKGAAFDSDRDGVRDNHKYNSYAQTIQNGLKSEYRMDGTSLAGLIAVDIARNTEDLKNTYRVDIAAGRYSDAYAVGDVASDTSSKENINAIYGEAKYAVTKEFVTTLNARFDNINYDYNNNLNSDQWDKDFNELSYRAGATYALEENQIFYTSVSTGFRVPTLAQMYAGDMATSTYSGTYANNTDIDTETTINYEIGFRHNTSLLSYEIAIFQLDRDDVIGRSSGNYASTRGVDVSYDNMSDVQNRGLELSLSSDKRKDYSFVFNYTYLDSKYTKYNEFNRILNDQDTGSDYVEGVYDLADNTVPRTSKHTIYLEGNYRALDSLLLTADMNYRSSQYIDDMNEVKIDGYAIFNLRSKYNIKLSGVDLEVFAKVDNVLDKQYYMMPRVTGDRNEDGIYDIRDMGLTVNPGRVYLAGLSARF